MQRGDTDRIHSDENRYVGGTCPKCKSYAVEVDDLILPTIIELNKKGYTTKYCCSGHMDNELVGTYILFTHEAPLKIPKGFIVEDGDAIYVEDMMRNLTGIEGFNELVRINRTLYKWALSLPPIDG